MLRRPSVALLIETSNAYARGLLGGVAAFLEAGHRWTIHLHELGRGEVATAWLRHWSGDGLIARIENPRIAEVVRRTGLPVVDLSAGRYLPGVPCVETNNGEIARLGLQHLVERGFRCVGFCGDSSFKWAVERQEAFIDLARRAGLRCEVFTPSSRKGNHSLARQQRELTGWLRELPRPIGLMACYDVMAQQLLELCRAVEFAVPEEMAILGVDNDELLCTLTTPPLSSVILNARRTGYAAAALLERMLAGEQVAPEVHLIDPLGVQTRQSTDTLAIENPDVAQAVRFIREHACDGINVEDVLAEVTLSRRALERLFEKFMGRSPHEEIVRVRVERVKSLLSLTDLPVAEVARRAGFQHVEYLSAAFKRGTGLTPSAYRRQAGPGPGAPGAPEGRHTGDRPRR